MYSERPAAPRPRRPSPRRRSALFVRQRLVLRPAPVLMVLALTLGGSLACGKKESPTPPPSRVPAPTQDLSVQQRGMEIILRMSYPSITLGGLALEEVTAVEVWELVRVMPEIFGEGAQPEGDSPPSDEEEAEPTEEGEPAAEEPQQTEPERPGLLVRLPPEAQKAALASQQQSREDTVFVDPREFVELAKLRVSLVGADLTSAVVGDQVVIRIPLEQQPSEEELHVFSVRTSAGGRRLTSADSNLVKLIPRVPPRPPASLEVTAKQSGVEISWTADEPGAGFRLYRRDAQSRDYGDPVYSAPAVADTYFDAGVRYGSRYIYTITSVSTTRPLVESAIAIEQEIDYRDRFEPQPPRDLVAFAEAARVRILWEAPADEDVEGYLIFRREPGEEFRKLTRSAVTATEYLDEEVAAGTAYDYYIVTVDQAGNQSRESEQISARVP